MADEVVMQCSNPEFMLICSLRGGKNLREVILFQSKNLIRSGYRKQLFRPRHVSISFLMRKYIHHVIVGTIRTETYMPSGLNANSK